MFKKANKVILKSEEEIELIRRACLLVSNTLAMVASELKEGREGNYLDKLAEEFIRDHNAVPGFKGYGGFPSTLCVSSNDQVVHGMPKDQIFKQGDIVSVDCGVIMDGFYGDSAFTFSIGEVSQEIINLLHVTNKSLYLGIKQAIMGKRIGDIGHAIQDYCERQNNYGVVRKLVGHGIGRNLHEPPEVPNFGKRGQGIKLERGMVIAIEPMVNMGSKNVRQLADGWTIKSKDGKPSAHFEHTVAIGLNEADVLSDHTIVENAIKNNPELMDFSINYC